MFQKPAFDSINLILPIVSFVVMKATINKMNHLQYLCFCFILSDCIGLYFLFYIPAETMENLPLFLALGEMSLESPYLK